MSSSVSSQQAAVHEIRLLHGRMAPHRHQPMYLQPDRHLSWLCCGAHRAVGGEDGLAGGAAEAVPGRRQQVAHADQLHRLRRVADDLGVVELDALLQTSEQHTSRQHRARKRLMAMTSAWLKLENRLGVYVA